MPASISVVAVHSSVFGNREGDAGRMAVVLVRECYILLSEFLYAEVGLD